MISNRSQWLFLLPLIFGRMVLCTPTVWNRKKDKLFQSTGIWKLNYFNYGVGCAIGHVLIFALNMEAILSGHATAAEILVCFYLLPTYLMGFTVEVAIIVYWKLGIHVVNQILDINKRFAKYFRVSRKKADGAESIIISSHILGFLIAFGAIPATAFLLQTKPGFFYNVRMQKLEYNLFLASIGAFAMCGDMLHIIYWGVAMYLQIHSNLQYLQMMNWKEGVTNSQLSIHITMYREIQLVHQLLFDNFGRHVIPIVHACAGIFMVSFLFNIIYFNVSTDPFFIMQMCFCIAISVMAFEVISKNICNFTEATREFLNSYSKINMPEISSENERKLKACRPIKVEIKPLLTYEKLTFVKIMQDVIMANTIDLLLGANEMNLQI